MLSFVAKFKLRDGENQDSSPVYEDSDGVISGLWYFEIRHPNNV